MGNGGKEFIDKDSLKEMTQSAFSKLGKVSLDKCKSWWWENTEGNIRFKFLFQC